MRLMILFIATVVFLLAAFTTYYFNEKVLLQTALGGFVIEDTMAPVGASLPGENLVTFANDIYTLTYSEGENVLTQYEVDTNNIDVRRGLFSVKERISEQETGEQFYPIKRAGTRYRLRDPLAANPLIWPTNFVQTLNPQITLTHSLNNGFIELRYREIIEGSEQVNIEKRYLLSIKGKTLVLQVDALNPPSSPFGYYQDFVFDSNVIPNNPSPSNIALSYAEWAPITIAGPLNNRYYLSNYFDYTKSNSQNWPWLRDYINTLTKSYLFAYTPSYSGGTAENYNSLSETFYITLSNDINDVMPKINRLPAQYRSELNNRMPLELWQIYMPPVLSPWPEKAFERAETRVIDVLNSYGLEDLLVILTAWRDQTHVGNCYASGPVNYPANPEWGGSEQMLKLSIKVKSYGYLFGLYQIHTDMYGTGLWWDPANLVLSRDGDWRNYGFVNSNCPPVVSPGTGILVNQPLIVKPDKWMYYAQIDTPLIKENYGVNSMFLDVHQKSPPPSFIDYDLDPLVTARSARAMNQLINSLLNYLRSEINGPVIGEGGSAEGYPADTIHAGYIEGVEGEGVARKINNIDLAPDDTPLIVDFELNEIKPLMVRFGMGYANRWTKTPGGPQEPEINILTYDWDKYMATQFAFGHSGYLNDEFLYADACFPSSSTECWSSQSAWSGNPTQYEIDLAKNTINLWVKQYYNTKAFQELYLPSQILEIKYLNPSGTLVPLSRAIDDGVDFYNPRIYLKYEDGTEVWINRDQGLGNVWTVISEGRTYYIPSNGWLGINSASNFLEYSALVNSQGNPDPLGHRVDYIRSNNYIMVDGRGVETNFGNGFNNVPITSTYLKVVKPNGWTLMEQSSGQFETGLIEYCGNGICSVSSGETCLTCSSDCGQCNIPNPYIEGINPNTIVNTELRNVQILGRDFYPRAIEFDGLEYSSYSGWTVSSNRDVINMVIPSGYPGGDKIIRVVNTNNVISNAETLRINYRFNYDLSLSPSSIVLAPGASQEIQAIVNVLPFVDIEEVSFSVTADPQISYQFVGADKCTPEPSGGEIKCSVRIRLTASPSSYLQTYNVQITGSSLTTNPQTEALGINTLPNPPSNLVVATLDSSSLKLDWIDNSDNEDGFRVEHKLHSSPTWTSIDLPTPNTQTYTHTGLSASTEYDYRILAYNLIGDSAWYPSVSPYYVSGTTSPTPQTQNPGGGGGGGGGGPRFVAQCNDKKDNDNDTYIDYPYDPGCLNKDDNIELESALINTNRNINSTLSNDSSSVNDGNNELAEEDKEIRVVFWLTIAIFVIGILIVAVLVIRSIRLHKRLREFYHHVNGIKNI